MSEFRHFDVQVLNSVTLLELADPNLFESLLVSELHDELLDYIATRSPRQLVVDFGRVTFCSSAVINGLLRAKRRVVTNGGRIKLCAMSQTTREAYRTLNLDGTVFDIYDTRDEAVQAFAP